MKILILKLITLFVLVHFMSGCATTPTPINEATIVPQDRVFTSPKVLSAPPAYFTIIRDSGLGGAEHYFEIWVNGILLVKLNAGEKYTTPIDPSAVIIELRMFNVIQTITPVQVETIFGAGKTYVYRAGIDGNLMLHLHRDLGLSK